MVDLTPVPGTYVNTPYFIPRDGSEADGNYTPYAEFVLRTRLTPQFPNLSFQMIPQGSTNVPGAIELSAIDERKGESKEAGAPGASETARDILTVVAVDDKGLATKYSEKLPQAVNDILTYNSSHCLLPLSTPPPNISKTWWISQISYLDIPINYSPIYKGGGNWLLDLSTFPDYSELYNKLNTSIFDQLVKEWKLK